MATLLNTRQSTALLAFKTGSSFDVDDHAVVLTLNDKGMIRQCSKTSRELLGCPASELIWKPISMLLPQLDGVQLMNGRRINPRLRFLSRLGHHFEVICPDGIRLASEIFLSSVENAGHSYLRVILRPVPA